MNNPHTSQNLFQLAGFGNFLFFRNSFLKHDGLFLSKIKN
jgi:hypothetical protein